MNHRIFNRRQAFAAVLGLTDGILNSLTPAAGRLVTPGNGFSLSMALRVGVTSALAGGVVFFVAELAQRNYELVHAERQLNLASHGRLAMTRLGRFVLIESSGATLTVVLSNFVGALAPLLTGMMLRGYRWAPIAFAVLLLGGLGVFDCARHLQEQGLVGNRSDGSRSGSFRAWPLAAYRVTGMIHVRKIEVFVTMGS